MSEMGSIVQQIPRPEVLHQIQQRKSMTAEEKLYHAVKAGTASWLDRIVRKLAGRSKSLEFGYHQGSESIFHSPVCQAEFLFRENAYPT
jgi:catechol-2,3-dioxygenase